jgi:hypothetical protein
LIKSPYRILVHFLLFLVSKLSLCLFLAKAERTGIDENTAEKEANGEVLGEAPSVF